MRKDSVCIKKEIDKQREKGKREKKIREGYKVGKDNLSVKKERKREGKREKSKR